MPKVTIKKSKSAAVAAKPAAKAATKAKTAAAKAAPAKEKRDNSAARAKVAKMVKAGTKMGEIASELGITAGQAKFLHMQNEVEAGEVPSISTSGNDEAIAKRIIAARNKQDDYSSWGYIAARTGLPEVKVKKLAEEHGLEVKGTHVAKERAAARPAPVKAAKKAGKVKADPSK